MQVNKISVIIATYNSGKDLEKSLKSFSDQTYKNKELLVIDGGSTDQTLSLIKKYQKIISYWISQPDKGISDAFNKGVKAAHGDYLFFLGAGDYFWSSDALENMMFGIDSRTDMLVCGRINRMSEDGKNILYTSGIIFYPLQLLYKMALPHQALFTNKLFFKKYGYFDLNRRYAMDYDLLLRAYGEFPRVVMKDEIVAAWIAGGIGKDRTWDIFTEYRKIRQKNKIAPVSIIYLIDFLSRSKYFLDNLFA